MKRPPLAVALAAVSIIAVCFPKAVSEAQPLGTSPSEAQPKVPADELGPLGHKTFALLNCAVLASFAGNDAEQARLFKAGLAVGHRFLTGIHQAQAANVDISKVINSNVPLVMVGRLGGPSDDFILGRVWEGIVEYEGKDLYEKIGNELPPADMIVQRAKNRFQERNCALF